MRNFSVRLMTIASTVLFLTACGGNIESSNPELKKTSISFATLGFDDGEKKDDTSAPLPNLEAQKSASRFLAQASFGGNMDDIYTVAMLGHANWLDEQLFKPQVLHRTYLDGVAATLPTGTKLQQRDFLDSFWKQAVTGDDKVRQRVTFALSEIFVVSFQNSNLPFYTRGVASYYDMLGQHAFGNFRNLLDGVARHPMMGIYLSSMGNKKENATSVPDENFARELMQLFTIGLYQLNQDGSLKMNGSNPIETYNHDDIAGLSKALTGWSWAGPDQTENRFKGHTQDPNRDWLPMQNYTAFHSTSEKRFLGKTIPSGSTGEADLKVALDTLFNHPNVGPFIGKQLIQRLVTSNPSPAYISRVAAAFANNGQGVRGDMKAIIRAVLLDPEAQNPNFNPQNPSRKIREPIARMAQWMRAFYAKSSSGRFKIGNIDDPMTGIGQSPLRSPTVFNFQRPGYVPPNTSIAEAGLTAPEMQNVGEISVAGYLNYMMDVIPNGAGTGSGVRDVQANYATEIGLASNATQLIDRIDLLLLNGSMSSTLRNQILTAVNSVTIPLPTSSNATQIAAAKTNRVHLAIFLSMASPEYIVQK